MVGDNYFSKLLLLLLLLLEKMCVGIIFVRLEKKETSISYGMFVEEPFCESTQKKKTH